MDRAMHLGGTVGLVGLRVCRTESVARFRALRV